MTMITTTELISVFEERHSVRSYDPTHKMSRDEIKELLEITQKAPSAWNLQHWRFLVFDDASAKEKLLPIAYGQQQIVQSSFVVAILADLEANKNAEKVYGAAVDKGTMSPEIKDRLVSQIHAAYQNPHVPRDQGILNASLAGMQLMLTAKAKGYDTCPMSGFDAQQFIEVFKVPERFLPIMLITVGKAAKPAHESSRFPIDEVTIWNSF